MAKILVGNAKPTNNKPAEAEAKAEANNKPAIVQYDENSIYNATLRQIYDKADVLAIIAKAKADMAEAEADIRYYSKKADSERKSKQINEAMTAKAKAEGVINSHPEPKVEIEVARAGLRLMIKEAQAILIKIDKDEAKASPKAKPKASKPKNNKPKAEAKEAEAKPAEEAKEADKPAEAKEAE